MLDAAHGAPVRPIRIAQRVDMACVEPHGTCIVTARRVRRRRPDLAVRADVCQGSRVAGAGTRSQPVETIAGMNDRKNTQ